MTDVWPKVLAVVLTTALTTTSVAAEVAVLDDFRSGIRHNASGSNLWNAYEQDCDKPQRLEVSGSHIILTGDATYGAFDRGCGGGHGNGLYMDFFPYPYQQPNGHTQDWIVSGNKNPDYNRLRFRMRCSHDTLQSSSTSLNDKGEPILSLGTYVKPVTSNTTGDQGAHFYHGLGFDIFGGQWSWFVYNRNVTYWRDNQSWLNYPEDPTQWLGPSGRTHYYEGLTRWYFDSGSNNVQSMKEPVAPLFRQPPTMDSWSGQVCEFADFQLSRQDDEPDGYVATLNGTYSGSRYQVSFNTIKGVIVRYRIRYAPDSLKTIGWSAGTDGGYIDSYRTSSPSVTWKSPAMDRQAAMWVAIRPDMDIQAISGIPMVVTTSQDSFFSDGDPVQIAGVSGCTTANGNWNVHVLPRQAWNGEDGSLTGISTDGNGYTTFTTASPHGLAVGRMVSAYVTDIPGYVTQGLVTAVTATTFTVKTNWPAGTLDHSWTVSGMPAGTAWNAFAVYAYSALELLGSIGCNGTPSGGTITTRNETKNFTEICIGFACPNTTPSPVLDQNLSMAFGDVLPLNATLAVNYPAAATIPGVHYVWTLTPLADTAASLKASSTSRASSAAGNARTTVPSIALSSWAPTPGQYEISVYATDDLSVSNTASKAVTLVEPGLSAVRVFPNPWRADKQAAATPVTFANLPIDAVVKIFTVSGHKVREMRATSTDVVWDLKNDHGDAVASGIYVYAITDGASNKTRGKLAVVR